MIPSEAIRGLLQTYAGRYQFLTVFQEDVSNKAQNLGGLHLAELSPQVLCFSLGPVKGLGLHANSLTTNTTLLEGLGFGLLSKAEDPNRVRVFRHSLFSSWEVYAGPYTSLVKHILHPEVGLVP